MKAIITSLLILVITSGCHKIDESMISADLHRWDSAIWDRAYVQGDSLYHFISDSLRQIDLASLTKADEALYDLIFTCAQDKLKEDFASDSVINVAVDYFREIEDQVNLCRALAYQGIVRYRLDPKDSSAFKILQEA